MRKSSAPHEVGPDGHVHEQFAAGAHDHDVVLQPHEEDQHGGPQDANPHIEVAGIGLLDGERHQRGTHQCGKHHQSTDGGHGAVVNFSGFGRFIDQMLAFGHRNERRHPNKRGAKCQQAREYQ